MATTSKECSVEHFFLFSFFLVMYKFYIISYNRFYSFDFMVRRKLCPAKIKFYVLLDIYLTPEYLILKPLPHDSKVTCLLTALHWLLLVCEEKVCGQTRNAKALD